MSKLSHYPFSSSFNSLDVAKNLFFLKMDLTKKVWSQISCIYISNLKEILQISKLGIPQNLETKIIITIMYQINPSKSACRWLITKKWIDLSYKNSKPIRNCLQLSERRFAIYRWLLFKDTLLDKSIANCKLSQIRNFWQIETFHSEKTIT